MLYLIFLQYPHFNMCFAVLPWLSRPLQYCMLLIVTILSYLFLEAHRPEISFPHVIPDLLESQSSIGCIHSVLPTFLYSFVTHHTHTSHSHTKQPTPMYITSDSSCVHLFSQLICIPFSCTPISYIQWIVLVSLFSSLCKIFYSQGSPLSHYHAVSHFKNRHNIVFSFTLRERNLHCRGETSLNFFQLIPILATMLLEHPLTSIAS